MMIFIENNLLLGRTDYVIALALAKDIISNWSPVPRPEPTSDQDEVDASRVRKMLDCCNYKPSWVKYPRRFLFALIFVGVNFTYAIIIVIKKVHF